MNSDDEANNKALDIIEQQILHEDTFKSKFRVAWTLATTCNNRSSDQVEIKSVDESKIWRELGYIIFIKEKKNYLRKSIKAYTKSIAYAPVGSTELSLAYAERSAVLFKARLYDDCLLDIGRALQSGYPDDLKTKLFVRQLLCFKALKPSIKIGSSNSMASAIQWLPNLKKNNPKYDVMDEYLKMLIKLEKPRKIIQFSPEIKYDNSIIVGASDAIKLKNTNVNKQQHAVATRDIKTGEFIYINKPFAVTIGNKRRYKNCWKCSRQTWSGLPCDNCPNVIYCSDECKNKAWDSYHSIECLVLGEILEKARVTEDLFSFKLIIKSLKLAGGLENLKKKIDDIDAMNDKSMIQIDGVLDVNSIDNFLRLDYIKENSTAFHFISAIRAVWFVAIFAQKTDILGEKMTIDELIESENENIFILGEIMLRFMMIIQRNSLSFTPTSYYDEIKWSSVIIPFYNIAKLSCDANVTWTNVGSKVGYYACKPIKQGEPIFVNFYGEYHHMPKEERDMAFKIITNGTVPCKCTACVKSWPITLDLPTYQTLPVAIERKFHDLRQKINEWSIMLFSGNVQKLFKLKDDVNSMNDKFHQHVTGPRREKTLLLTIIRNMYFLIHTDGNLVD